MTVCGFCKNQPVVNAATWLDGKERPPAPCPRCGKTYAEPRRVTVWVCDDCGYWRKDKSTGEHQTTDPENPTGRLVSHSLRPAEFVECPRPAGALTEESDSSEAAVGGRK